MRGQTVATPVKPVARPVARPVVKPAFPMGRTREAIKRILYDRVSLSGVNALASTTTALFNANTKATAPEKTNMLEQGKMGPAERFTIQGIGVCINANSTNAGLVKYLPEARLRIGVGPDDVEKLSVPLVFLPTPAGIVLNATADLVAKTPAGFYRLDHDQEIYLSEGQPFSVRIVQSAAALAMEAGEKVDFFVQLFGAYDQQVIR